MKRLEEEEKGIMKGGIEGDRMKRRWGREDVGGGGWVRRWWRRGGG